MMSSCCTLRLNRRSAFSSGSPSCKRTSAKGSHLQTCQKGPEIILSDSSRIHQLGENPRILNRLGFTAEIVWAKLLPVRIRKAKFIDRSYGPSPQVNWPPEVFAR